MKRNRKAKILATLGPTSSDKKVIEDLFVAGCDVFRLNFSHGDLETHRENYEPQFAINLVLLLIHF